MNLLKFLRGRGSAPVARERLQILLAHERTSLRSNDLLGTIREEILAVIARHVTLDPAKVQVKMDRGGTVSTLEVDIEIPNDASARGGSLERQSKLENPTLGTTERCLS